MTTLQRIGQCLLVSALAGAPATDAAAGNCFTDKRRMFDGDSEHVTLSCQYNTFERTEAEIGYLDNLLTVRLIIGASATVQGFDLFGNRINACTVTVAEPSPDTQAVECDFGQFWQGDVVFFD